MYCCICGDERDLGHPRRFWDADDGWRVGRFCRYCRPEADRQPQPDDYAYKLRGEYLADVDEALDVLYG